jgi:hypothetical protein
VAGVKALDGWGKPLGAGTDALAVELSAVVGLEAGALEGDPVAAQVAKEVGGSGGGVGFGDLVGEAEVEQARAGVADGVLEAGQAQELDLGQVEGQTGEVFDVHLDALEGSQPGLDGAQIVLFLSPALALSRQAVPAQDAADGMVAAGQIELFFEPAGAETALLVRSP